MYRGNLIEKQNTKKNKSNTDFRKLEPENKFVSVI